MIDHGSDDTLRPVLKEIEQKLDRHIAAACSAPPAAEETTGQLQRLSETLADAAESARAAAALRRRLRANNGAERGKADRQTARESIRPAAAASSVRRRGTPARGIEARQADSPEKEKE